MIRLWLLFFAKMAWAVALIWIFFIVLMAYVLIDIKK